MGSKEVNVIIGNLIDSAHDRDYWRALGKPALNLGMLKTWSYLVTVYYKM